jgi:hypothetical protein
MAISTARNALDGKLDASMVVNREVVIAPSKPLPEEPIQTAQDPVHPLISIVG